MCSSISAFRKLYAGVCESGNPIVMLICFTFSGKQCNTGCSRLSLQSTTAVSFSDGVRLSRIHCGKYLACPFSVGDLMTVMSLSLSRLLNKSGGSSDGKSFKLRLMNSPASCGQRFK